MNREEFISYLNDPSGLDKNSLPEINELVEEFPFFQSSHLLFLKNLHNLDHIRFGSQLKRSSLVIGDRELLYKFLFPVISGSETKDIESVATESEINKQDPVVAEPEIAEKDVVTMDQEISGPDKEVTAENETVARDMGTAAETDSGKSSESTEADQSMEELRRQIHERLAEIKAGKKAADEAPQKKQPAEIKAKPEEEPAEVKAAQEQHEEQADEIKAGPKQHEEQPAAGEKNIDTEEFHGEDKDLLLLGNDAEVEDKFSGDDRDEVIITETDYSSHGVLLDLDYPAGEADDEGKQESEDERLRDIITEAQPFETWLNYYSAPLEEDRNEEAARPDKEEKHINPDLAGDTGNDEVAGSGKDDLIDRFIRNNPRIQPNKADSFDEMDMSVGSIEENKDLFTETLANIYIKQGYYSKAIFFYKELSLKFPEKSAYFAARIEGIEQRIKKL